MKKNKNIDYKLFRVLLIKKLIAIGLPYKTISNIFNRKSKSYVIRNLKHYNLFEDTELLKIKLKEWFNYNYEDITFR